MFKQKALFTILIGITSFACFGNTKIDCTTQGVYSCHNEDGYCLEFVGEIDDENLDFWKGTCAGFSAPVVEGPCDRKEAGVTCINNLNPIIPIIIFDTKIDWMMAAQMCTSSGGKVCENNFKY